MRRVAPAALLLAVSFVLSGCFRIDIDARVGRDGTVGGTVEVVMDREALNEQLAPYGQTLPEEDALAQVVNVEALEALGDDGRDVVVEQFDRGDTFGFTATFDDLEPGEFVAMIVNDDPRYVFERDGDLYRFAVEGSDQEAAFAQQAGVDLELALTFPGDIVDTDGEVDNRTVRWTSYEDVADGVSVTSQVPLGASDDERIWTGAGIAAVLVVALGCAFAWRRPRG